MEHIKKFNENKPEFLPGFLISGWWEVENLLLTVYNGVPDWTTGNSLDGIECQAIIFQNKKEAESVIELVKNIKPSHDPDRKLEELRIVENNGFSDNARYPTPSDRKALGIDKLKDLREKKFLEMYIKMLPIWHMSKPPSWLLNIFNDNSSFITGVLATQLHLKRSPSEAYKRFYKIINDERVDGIEELDDLVDSLSSHLN